MRSLLIEREGVRLLTEESEVHPQWKGVKLIFAESSEVKPQREGKESAPLLFKEGWRVAPGWLRRGTGLARYGHR